MMANVIEAARESSSRQHGLSACATSDAVDSGVGFNEGVVGSGVRAGVGAEATLGDAAAGLSVSGPVEQPAMTANVTNYQAPGQTDDIYILDLDGKRQTIVASHTPDTSTDTGEQLEELLISLDVSPI